MGKNNPKYYKMASDPQRTHKVLLCTKSSYKLLITQKGSKITTTKNYIRSTAKHQNELKDNVVPKSDT